ncbi:hypothetical protein K450DRAFT_258633 [Umbelopsis ramanniana AG]|uniref:Uncharacterized protein n=1 Tax=Umbelopsis ramanniana AG TaxID=1314678 RepID=A0AAD5HB07_UMBRA|nr:uncharacterized protein K450DRAFT_258633 [Umbelopsis ramanniana AG]KAI8576046.1 hypothetical protein K450DRAFT_258633 [Umbelopsis ramanniana AG]
MGNCLGSRKPSGNRLNEPGDVARTPAGPQPDAATAREMRLAAAEGRQKKQNNRGVQGSGGKLSQKLQAQSKLKPGQENEENVERIVWD